MLLNKYSEREQIGKRKFRHTQYFKQIAYKVENK